MKPKIIHFKPTNKRENGRLMLDLEKIPFPENFVLREKSMLVMPPLDMGGNHKHPRTECFLVLGGDLEFVWLDDNGEKKFESMISDNSLLLFVVPPYLPHAVVNKSKTKTGYLLEFADMKQRDVEVSGVF